MTGKLTHPLSADRPTTTLTQQLNKSQAFRVLTPQKDLVYIHGEFVRTRDMVSEGRVLPLESAHTIEALKKTISEKGEKFFQAENWWDESVLGLTDAYVKTTSEPEPADEYYKALKEFNLILLDDGGDEIGDFICVGEKKIALVHAKASKKLHSESLTELQAVGRQVIASLAFCSTAARTDGIKNDRWVRKYTANTIHVEYDRIMRNAKNIPLDEISPIVRRAMQNPSISREIWIVAGRLIDIDGLRDKAKSNCLTNHRRQLLMYIDGLNTACARANAKLQIFGS